MRTVRSQIALTFVIISVLVIAFLGILLSYEIERYYVDRLQAGLRTETNVIAALLQESAQRSEARGTMEKDLGAFATSAQMRITLIDSSGVVMYDSSVPDSLLPTLENHAQRPEILEARQIGTGAT